MKTKIITQIRYAIAIVITITGLLLVHNAIHSQSLTARPLGVFTLGQAFATGCPGGFTCWNFTDSCPNVAQTIPGAIALKVPTVRPTGMVVFFSGAGAATGGKERQLWCRRFSNRFSIEA